MKVRVTKAFRYRGTLLTEGTVLTVEAQYFPRLANLVDPLTLDDTEQAYFTLLARFWSHVTEGLPMAEIRQLVDRLDALYQELHQAGREVPIRLPLERSRREAGHQKEMAL